jgi:hypothetical protein
MRRTITRSIALIVNIGSVPAALVIASLIASICSSAIAAGYANSEAAQVVVRLLAMPVIKTVPGFNAKIIVPPDQIYDPLQIVPHGDRLWVNDDGGESEKGGGRLVSVDAQGNVSVLISPDQMLPDVGMDIAPEGFGNYGGQVFLLTQPDKGENGL